MAETARSWDQRETKLMLTHKKDNTIYFNRFYCCPFWNSPADINNCTHGLPNKVYTRHHTYIYIYIYLYLYLYIIIYTILT